MEYEKKQRSRFQKITHKLRPHDVSPLLLERYINSYPAFLNHGTNMLVCFL
jgi:hypothetical protein